MLSREYVFVATFIRKYIYIWHTPRSSLFNIIYLLCSIDYCIFLHYCFKYKQMSEFALLCMLIFLLNWYLSTGSSLIFFLVTFNRRHLTLNTSINSFFILINRNSLNVYFNVKHLLLKRTNNLKWPRHSTIVHLIGCIKPKGTRLI